MPYNGSGVFAAPANSWNPAVADTEIDETDWAALLADFEAGFSGVITSDGQTTTTARIPFAAGISTTLAAASAIQVRSGASGSLAQIGIGRTSDECTLGVAAANDAFQANITVVAGDTVLRSPSGKVIRTGANLVDAIPNSGSATYILYNHTGGTLLSIRGDGAAFNFPSIGTTASAANAFIDNASSNNLLRSTSSGIYKTNIETLSVSAVAQQGGGAISIGDVPPSIVDSLNPVTYTSLAVADDPSRKFIGLIAEDVFAVAPELITFTKMKALPKNDPRYDAQADPESEIPESVQYERLSVVLLAEVQGLRARVAALEAR